MINTTSEQIQAMQLIRESIQAINFSHGHDYIAIFSPDYVSWTANKVKILIFFHFFFFFELIIIFS